MKRDFLSIMDLTKAEIEQVLERAAALKAERKQGKLSQVIAGRTVGMIFNKPSTRTRVSFEVGVYELGGKVVYMTDQETRLAKREPLSHAGRVLSRYLHALVIRTYAQADIEELARFSDIPIINALTDMYHPCQVLSDMLTIVEHKGKMDGLKLAWVGDGNNMAHSWLNAAALMGFDLALAVPEGYEPDADLLKASREKAPGQIIVTHDPLEAAKDADVINTDVWASMGQEDEAEARAAIFRPFQVNSRLMDQAAEGAVVLHCLPAHVGDEITEDVIEGPQSVVFDQAENRLHAQKALMEFLMK